MYLDLRELSDEFNELKDSVENDSPLDEDDKERFEVLKGLDSDLNGLEECSKNESTAIPDSEFEDYARQLAEDIGYVGHNNPMEDYIDWGRWAEDLKMDYTSFDFYGETYWVRY